MARIKQVAIIAIIAAVIISLLGFAIVTVDPLPGTTTAHGG